MNTLNDRTSGKFKRSRKHQLIALIMFIGSGIITFIFIKSHLFFNSVGQNLIGGLISFFGIIGFIVYSRETFFIGCLKGYDKGYKDGKSGSYYNIPSVYELDVAKENER
jgi:hypothetical protein